jgi:hypothetical protein
MRSWTRLGDYEIRRSLKAVSDAMTNPGVQLPPYLAVSMPTIIEALTELLERRDLALKESPCDA